MNRLTKDDVKEMGMIDLAHNQVFIKDGEAWYRDFEREISARDLAKEMFDFHNVKYSSNLDEFDEDMMYLLDDGYETIEGIIALFYRALWSMADVREKLKAYEDTGLEPEDILSNIKFLSNELNNALEKLAEYEVLEEQGLLINLPCKVGDTVYYVNLSNKVINYTVSGFKVDCFGNLQINVARHLESGYFLDMQLGKTVFLTREEAEKALNKEENK